MRSVQCVVPRKVLRQSLVGRVGVLKSNLSRRVTEDRALRLASSGPRAVLRSVLLDLRATRSADIVERLSRRTRTVAPELRIPVDKYN